MKKKRIFSILSSIIIVMMLFPQLPARATTDLDLNASTDQVIIEENEMTDKVNDINSDDVISENNSLESSTTDNSDSEDITSEKNSEYIQDTSIDNQEQDVDNKVDEASTLSEEDNTSLKDESINQDIVGEVYEYKNGISTYSYFEPQVYEREEFNLKQQSFNDVIELQTKTDSNYEIALAYSDGSYVYVDSAEDIDEAVNKMEDISDIGQVDNGMSRASFSVNDDEAITVVLNREGRVVRSTKSMGRILKHIDGEVYGYFDVNTNIYSNSSLTNAFTYINQGYVDDVPIIEDNGRSAKILVNGYQGWINRDVNSDEYDMIIVPINQVSNPSYYFSENGILKHFISSNLRSSSRIGTTIQVGVAPSYLKSGVRYLSYDGRYFYDGSNIEVGLNNLIGDLQNNNHSTAVNGNDPYYNYYNYLPFRSKTTYSAADLNKFIDNNTIDISKLRGSGAAFIDAQNKYGVNALLALGIAINESDWGKSTIAQKKNNIFGINAVDSNPGQAADTYASVSDSIYEFAKNQISRAYSDPANWAYYGGFLGNKNLGANVKYASDPFWGEKASQYAFLVDYYLSNNNISNLKEYNYNQLAVFTSNAEVKNASGQLLYNVRDNFLGYIAYIDTPVVVTSINGSTYEINPERNTPVNSGGTANRYHGDYSFGDKAYVPASSMKLINTKRPSSNVTNSWEYIDGKWYYYNSQGEISIGWTDINGYKYYFNNDGTMVTGWKNINGSWYYFWDGGSMATGWVKVGNYWYYTNSNGVMATGWVKVGNYWYYFWGGGSMATGWVKVGNDWYYFWDGGSMATGWVKSGGYWYYMKSNGVMATGWQNIGNKKYYFWGGGSMATGWVNLDGKSYYFNPDGSLA